MTTEPFGSLVVMRFALQTLDSMTCGEAGSVGAYCRSGTQYTKSTIDDCCFKNKREKSIFPLLSLTGRERKRDGDTKRRQRGEGQDTLILRGLSPYITVRSTLQPPLEREHVVNTSSSGQSL